MENEKYPVLLLNADYRPLSYNPLSTISWMDAVKALHRNKIILVAEYDKIIRSQHLEMFIPSVVAHKHYVPVIRTEVPFTRYNVMNRDKFTCLYCAEVFKTEELTFDHVIPESRGGKTDWWNIATCCRPCNFKKRNRTPEESGMKLLYEPYVPNINIHKRKNRLRYDNLHTSWIDYVYWDNELK